MRSTIIIASISVLCALLSACDRYLITLNDRPLSEPKPLFSAFTVADKGLAGCLRQLIEDQGIRRAEQLVALTCSHAGIASLEGIETFDQLQTVNLATNQITSVTPLFTLSKVRSLSLEDNPDLDCRELETLARKLSGSASIRAPKHCSAQ